MKGEREREREYEWAYALPWNKFAIEIYGKQTIYTTFIGISSLACSRSSALYIFHSIPIAFNFEHVEVYSCFFGFVCRRAGNTNMDFAIFGAFSIQ